MTTKNIREALWILLVGGVIAVMAIQLVFMPYISRKSKTYQPIVLELNAEQKQKLQKYDEAGYNLAKFLSVKNEIHIDKSGLVVIDRIWTPEIIKEEIQKSKYPTIIDKLVDCESDYTAIKRIDRNGYYSYGILQYQSSTARDFSKRSGIKTDPMNPVEAIRLTEWAIDEKLGFHWSCWKIQELSYEM